MQTHSTPLGKPRRDAPSVDALRAHPSAYTAATYIRESRFLETVEGFGMIAQATDARAFCARMGWRNPDALNFADGVDENASGVDWDLKGLNLMLDAAEEGAFQVLVVPRNDRFARNMVKAMVLEQQLQGAGVRVVYGNLPLDSQGTAEGNMLKNTLHTFAEYEREKIAFRTARESRARYLRRHGTCPLWLRPTTGNDSRTRRRAEGAHHWADDRRGDTADCRQDIRVGAL